MELQGKKAIVLGGSSGIGLAATNQLADAGTRVVAVSRNPQRAQATVRAGVVLHASDVRDRAALSALFAAHAPFDILVNAATGGVRAFGPFLQMDLDGYQASFDKLWGYTNSVRLAAEHMDERGAIVLVSGTPARRAKPGHVALASVGGAVEAFCRAVAPEIVPRRINVVSPGVIDTPMFGDAGGQRQQTLAQATAKHLIPRPGMADEVASAILFLLKNDFVTGTTVDVDGGWLLS
jgi:NAD(P)-dependent dehydrogenase (short-subunit alcohol dehydrogenase family)